MSYHKLGSCNKCGGLNNKIQEVKDTCNGYICDCTTKCSDCGHADSWSYGHYESGEHMVSNAVRYGEKDGHTTIIADDK